MLQGPTCQDKSQQATKEGNWSPDKKQRNISNLGKLVPLLNTDRSWRGWGSRWRLGSRLLAAPALHVTSGSLCPRPRGVPRNLREQVGVFSGSMTGSACHFSHDPGGFSALVPIPQAFCVSPPRRRLGAHTKGCHFHFQGNCPPVTLLFVWHFKATVPSPSTR